MRRYYYLVTELHGDIWGPKGIDKDPIYTYRPLPPLRAATPTDSPGSSLNSKDNLSANGVLPPNSPHDPAKSRKKSTDKVDSPRGSDSLSIASTASLAPSSAKSSKKSIKSEKSGKVSAAAHDRQSIR